jgi:hypothetical protein
MKNILNTCKSIVEIRTIMLLYVWTKVEKKELRMSCYLWLGTKQCDRPLTCRHDDTVAYLGDKMLCHAIH